MAAFSLAQVGFAALGLLVFKIVHGTYKSYNFARLAKANGSEKPYNVSGSWPFSIINGWQRLFRFMDIVKNGGDVIEDGFGRLFEHANTVQATQFDGSVEIDTIEPANIQAMLATQFKDFGMGKMRINQFYPILGNSIFSSDGSDWEHSRSLFRPQFNREQINDMEETEQAAQQLINALGPTDSTGWTKDTELLPLLYNFTLDTATAFLFGESVNSQAINISQQQQHTNPQATSQAKQFMADFELASEYMMHRIRGQSLYWLADGLQFRRAVRRIRAFTEHFVQRVLDPAAREKAAATGKKYNLLAALATETQDRTELRNQTLAILIAGRDTTAGLLGWSFERLALHPDVFAKLRAAILRDFPPGGEPITFAKLKACRYLQHFLNEVLRLHPNVPINNRTTTRPTTLPVGGGPTQTSPIALPAGRTVTFSVYLLHRRADLWGPDALEFRPERWGEGKIPAWQFLPFSGGPRICLGQQFALTEAAYVLVRMLQRFEGVEGVGGGDRERLRKGIGLTMWPAGGVRVRFRRAGGGE